MRTPRPWRTAAVVAAPLLAVLTLLPVVPARGTASSAASAEVGGPAGLPAGVPPAARAAEPVLPAPEGWPFGEGFPRTSGAGRLESGALLWTDFLYDDHGARGVQRSGPVAGLAPTAGTYEYPAGPAHANGADIFRTAVGLTATDTWWRIDWTTLADPSVPIAAFALDTDADQATGVAQWPAGAGVRSPGIDRFLVVSSRGAWLHGGPAVTDVSVLGGQVFVDTAARSFVVRLPRPALEPTGSWHVRLAAGLADAEGDGFAPVPDQRGALPGQPAVYNVAFRSHQQEAPEHNFWMERAQAEALTLGDVSAFVAAVQWGDLAAGVTQAEPLPTGYTNRWYVSSVELGHGVVRDASYSGDLRPNFLGRVQPYAVYVPTGYQPGEPTPLTWVLHSLSVQHNQYGAYNPGFLRKACEDRGSICATTLGRGPDGWYFDEAELDLWEVWNRLAATYSLDPRATVLSGYSMGGYGAYRLAGTYPDVFAKAVVLAGPPACGVRVARGIGFAATPGTVCETDGSTDPLVANLRSVPLFIAHGAADELVPVSSVLERVKLIDDLGLRHRFELYPGEDHMAWAMRGSFASAAEAMGTPLLEGDPARVVYAWRPNLVDPAGRFGPTGAWWVQEVAARAGGPGSVARAVARSAALADPSVVHIRDRGPVVGSDGVAGAYQQLDWQRGASPALAPHLDVELVNVASLALDVPRSGIPPGAPGTAAVQSDGQATVVLAGLAPGAVVKLDGVAVATADAGGRAAVPVGRGRWELAWA